MSRIYYFILSVLFIMLFIINVSGAKRHSAKQQEAALSRAQFALNLPDVNDLRITKLSASLPVINIRTLKFHVLKPFDAAIPQDKIFIKTNGEAATTLCEKRVDREGHLIICDLEAKPGFKLKFGKNVIEIIAESRPDQRTKKTEKFYASYVLMIGASKTIPEDETAVRNSTLEKIPVSSGNDQIPPDIFLDLNGGLRGASIKLSGSVADDAGKIQSFKINGQSVALTESKGKRDLVAADDETATTSAKFVYDFTQTVSLNRAVLIEAIDQAGNITRLTVPVRGGENTARQSFTGKKYALLAGISNYNFTGDGLKNLQFADADARAMRDFLKSPQGGSFADENIRLLLNKDATLDGIREAMTFLKRAGENDLVVIFLAGHGAPDPFDPKNLYYLMADTKISVMDKTALAMTELQTFLDSEVRARRTLVFVDTCHSAGLSGKKFAAKRDISQANLTNLYASKLFREEGRAVLTSSDVDETSFESAKWGGHGVFTFALLEGLQGKADANGDKFITAGEIFNYVTDRVAQETNFRQNPRPLPGANKNLTLATVAGK